jgi:hypothetical protein
VTDIVWSDRVVTLRAEGQFSVEVSRDPELSVCVRSPERLGSAEIVHPVMAFVAAVVASWTGRLSFHAAAVVLRGRAWLLMAPPGGGKSTLAACLRSCGQVVLSDDLAVLDGRTVLAGPRSADLREGAATHLGSGDLMRTGADRMRWRTDLGGAPYEVPLGGLVGLEWGDGLELRPARVAEVLQLLAAADGLGRGPVTPTGFLDLLDVPAYVLRRAPSWEVLDATLESIEAVAAAVTGGQPGVLEQQHGGEDGIGRSPGGGQALIVDHLGDVR